MKLYSLSFLAADAIVSGSKGQIPFDKALEYVSMQSYRGAIFSDREIRRRIVAAARQQDLQQEFFK